MADLSGLYGLLGGGAFLALIGTLLSTRTGRQKDFDARVDSALKAADEENAALERENRFLGVENVRLTGDNNRLKAENERLRWVLAHHGINADTGMQESP